MIKQITGTRNDVYGLSEDGKLYRLKVTKYLEREFDSPIATEWEWELICNSPE